MMKLHPPPIPIILLTLLFNSFYGKKLITIKYTAIILYHALICMGGPHPVMGIWWRYYGWQNLIDPLTLPVSNPDWTILTQLTMDMGRSWVMNT